MSSLGRLFIRANDRFPLQVMRGTFRHYSFVIGVHMPHVPTKSRVAVFFAEAGTIIFLLTLLLFVLSCLFVVVIFVAAAGLRFFCLL